MDEDDCISKVRGLLRGKILMGCDLQEDIKALNIKVEELLGIRDISGSIAIQKVMKNQNPLNGLKKMAQEILTCINSMYKLCINSMIMVTFCIQYRCIP